MNRAQFIILVLVTTVLCLFLLPQSNVSAPIVTKLEKPTFSLIPDSLNIYPEQQSSVGAIEKIIQETKAIIVPKRVFKGWTIKSVSSMKETKDKICKPDSQEFIDKWVAKAKELGVNYISIETPYDEISCGSTLAYTKQWVKAIRNQGLHIWHRHMPIAFEGIYGVKKDNTKNYLMLIQEYISQNPDLFDIGDIFTPIPEPQTGGIQGINNCQQNVCMFTDAQSFNAWIRDAIAVSQSSFESIGLKNKIKIGYFGFDGYVVWGSNNNDWHGILEDETIKEMGNITIDHYPQIIGTTMSDDLDILQKKYPKTQIVIGEWGAISNTKTTEEQIAESMGAAERTGVIGFNYWHMGIGGYEALINGDFTNKPGFDLVKSHFMKKWE